MENRNGLLIEFAVEPADGYAERKSARAMLETELPGSRRITLGADKGYDTAAFVAACRALKVTPHIARNQSSRQRLGARPRHRASWRLRGKPKGCASGSKRSSAG
jgi:IS5 family transposase